MRLEHRDEPLAPRPRFIKRFALYAMVALLVLLIALGIGVWGYHSLGGLPWVSALENASMILAGMGPVDVLLTTDAKLFASFYALASGILFLTTVSLLLAPIVHRLLHHMHLSGSRK